MSEADLGRYADWAHERHRGLSLVGVGGGDVRLRVAFYEQCLRVLLSQWSRSKRTASDAWEPPLDADTALALLRTLAWELHRAERRDDLSKPELLLHLEERLQQLGRQESAFQVLRWLHREAGVLEELAPRRYGFLHLGVQEYLAALQVASVGDELLGELCERCGDPWWQEVLLLAIGLPGRRLFTPFMKRLLASATLLERADVVRACVDEAPEVELEPFLEWLAPERDAARQAAVLRLVRDRRDPELKARVEALRTSDDGTVRALAVQIAEEMERTRTTEERCDVFVIHHDDDGDGAAELRERLERRALRVRTLPVDGDDDVDEEVLAGTGQVAVVVGARRPWEEASLRSWIRLFRRRECELVPVRLPGFEATEAPEEMGFEPWLVLDEAWNGLERLAGIVAAKAVDAATVVGRAFTEPLTETRFLWIPGDQFKMGSRAVYAGEPIHDVRISPFWLAETPVTNRQYTLFLAETGHEEPPTWRDRRFSTPEQPVVSVNWHDAQAFCRWLGGKSGLEVGLPTEAQWEFAARGPESREYPWGDAEPDDSRACFGQDWKKDKPALVGSFPDGKGPFGNLDQAGNVWEWCHDAWDEKAYAKRGENEPLDPFLDGEGEDLLRVLRGGAWSLPAVNLRAAVRLRDPASLRFLSVGFRLVCRSREP